MNNIDAKKLGSFEKVINLGEDFRKTALDDMNWIDDAPVFGILCTMWGSNFVNGYATRSAEENTHILQVFDSILQEAWDKQDQRAADAMDEFGESLEQGVRENKLPRVEKLFVGVGTYLQNIVHTSS